MHIAEIRGILFSPSKTVQKERKTPVEKAFFSMFPPLALSSFIIALVTRSLLVFVIFFFVILMAVVGLSIWTHVWVFLLGGRKGIRQTMKAVFYGSTPFLLFCWLLTLTLLAQAYSFSFIVSLFLLCWSAIISAKGIKTFHTVSLQRAHVSVAVSLAIVLLFFALVTQCTSSMGVYGYSSLLRKGVAIESASCDSTGVHINIRSVGRDPVTKADIQVLFDFAGSPEFANAQRTNEWSLSSDNLGGTYALSFGGTQCFLQPGKEDATLTDPSCSTIKTPGKTCTYGIMTAGRITSTRVTC